jgi:hypothetical protein
MNGTRILKKIEQRRSLSDDFKSELLEGLNQTVNDSYFTNIQDIIKKFEKDEEDSSYLRTMKDVYEEIVDDMMENVLHFNTVDHIFFIYTYISCDITFKYIMYIYPYLLSSDKNIIHDRFLIFIYMNMLKHSLDYDDSKITYVEYNNIYEDQMNMIKRLYEEEYIRNPLYSTYDQIEDESYFKISLFDFYVHSTFVMELPNLGNFLLKVIMQNRYNKNDFDQLFNNYVNLDSLFMLDEYSKNVGRLCIERMYENFDTIYFYKYKFFYYLIKEYIDIMKKEEYQTNMNYLIYFMNYMIDNDIYMIYFSNTYEFSDLLPFIAHQILISNDRFDRYIVKRLNESNLTNITHTYITNMWFREIYVSLNKYRGKLVQYEPNDEYFYVEISGNRTKISFDEYVDDIVKYLSKCNNVLCDYLVTHMDNYVNSIYVDVKKIETTKLDNDICCAICMDNIEVGCVTQCNGCNNYFHKKCQKDLFTSKHKFCPLCRKCVYSTMLVNVEMRYKLFSQVLTKKSYFLSQ